MFRPSPELIILIFGVLSIVAALEHVPDVKQKTTIIKSLFIVGLLTQIMTHLFQYTYAVTNKISAQKEVEASTRLPKRCCISHRRRHAS
jgi:hypothetical protein